VNYDVKSTFHHDRNDASGIKRNSTVGNCILERFEKFTADMKS